MAEYIERGAALKEIDQSYGLYEASLRVSGIPTADVAPVRHGRWLDGKCTVCGWEEPDVCTYDGYETEDWIETPYCPNCGAIMDGGESNAGTDTH